MSPIRRAFVILFVAAGVVTLALLLAQDQDTLKVRSAIGVDAPAHPAYLAALVGADLATGTAFDVLTNGDQIFPAMLDAIRYAKRRISLETYIYEDGTVGRQFTDALEQAARRGVRVQILMDAVGASGASGDDIKRLTDAGCIVARFNEPAWYALEELNYRTHRKILVVDGEVGFTGGVGFADHWLGNAQDKDHWRDTQIRMRGPIVGLLEGAFYENFVEAIDEASPQLDDVAASDEPGSPAMLVRSSPTGGSNDLKRLYLLAIAGARRTLDIQTPYFVMDESTQWALEDAVRRGVRIRILMESHRTDAPPVKYASRHGYEPLLALGIELYEYQPTMMHTKVMVMDGRWSMFGSANFDNRSLELNDELNVAVTSADLASRLLQDFEQDLRLSRKVDLAAWRQRSLLDKTREQFWSWFGEIF